MITAGLKLTQSGGISLLNDDKLELNIEIQKLANNRRYSDVEELDDVTAILVGHGYQVRDIDRWVIDGWDGADHGTVSLLSGHAPVTVTVAPYRETAQVPDPALPGAVRASSRSTGRSAPTTAVHVPCFAATSSRHCPAVRAWRMAQPATCC